MKIFLKKIRDILIADAYLQTLLTSIARQVHVVNISDVRNPIAPCVTFEAAGGPADPWNLNRHNNAFIIQVFSEKNYEECENIYWNEDAAVLEEYTYAQGVKSLLHGQKYMDAIPYIEHMVALDDPDYLFDERSKRYILRVPYRAIFISSASLQVR